MIGKVGFPMPMPSLLACLARNYHRFLLGTVVAALAVITLESQPVVALVIWTLASACQLAAASRALGLIREPVLVQVLGRGLVHFLRCLVLGLVFGVAAFVAFIAAGALSPSWLPWRTTGWVVFALLALVILARAWPVYSAPFVFEGRVLGLRATIVSGFTWDGPGVFAAWRMTRSPGAFHRFTLPVLGAWLVVGGATAAASTFSDGGVWMGVVAAWVFVLSPALHLFTVATAERLRAASGEPSGRAIFSST